MIRIAIIDDHEIVRRGISAVLSKDAGLTVVGEAADGQEALRIIRKTRPDVALVDVRLPGISGIELCYHIQRESPQTQVLILTAYLDDNVVRECIRAGAGGFVLKDVAGADLLQSIRELVQGRSPMDSRATRMMMQWMQSGSQAQTQPRLTLRDIDILRLIAKGLTNREIGQRLGLSENTIKSYIQELYQKLDAHSRIEVVMRATKGGIL
ncbi:MAG TPA: response regulator transcription factor [Anaerolineae bacterium]|nr:response regulator transcription factor [Anaerolineae bacterium]HOR00652.1 response regulator transcription factor [Anaerolineae bacterium]HPL28587.1 response regulator transcription factor [Anaerolineae bacterium]